MTESLFLKCRELVLTEERFLYQLRIKLLNQTDFADAAWLNIPNYLLEDSQLNAEYVAYGTNYLSGISW